MLRRMAIFDRHRLIIMLKEEFQNFYFVYF